MRNPISKLRTFGFLGLGFHEKKMGHDFTKSTLRATKPGFHKWGLGHDAIKPGHDFTKSTLHATKLGFHEMGLPGASAENVFKMAFRRLSGAMGLK